MRKISNLTKTFEQTLRDVKKIRRDFAGFDLCYHDVKDFSRKRRKMRIIFVFNMIDLKREAKVKYVFTMKARKQL